MNLFKASISTFATKMILFLLSIISSVLVVRLIGAEGKGIVSVFQTFFNTTLNFAQISIGIGMVFYGLKENKLSTYYNAGITFSFIVSTMLLILGLLAKDLIQDLYFKDIPSIYIYLGLALFYLNSLFLMTQSYSRARKKPLVYNSSSLIENGLYVFIVVFYWFLIEDITPLDVIIAHALGKTGSIVYTYIALKIKPIFTIKNFLYIKKMLKFSAKSHLGTISQNLNLRLDILVMGAMLANEEIGYYSIAVMVAQFVWFIPESVSVFLFPKIASYTNLEEAANVTAVVNRITIFAALLLGICIYFLGSLLIPWMYGIDFEAAIIPMNILLIGTFGLSVQKILTKYFSGTGKPILSSYTTIIGLIINLPMLYIFIPEYGIIGAALATAITYCAMGVISVLIFKKVTTVNYSLLDLLFIKKSDIKLLVDQIKTIVLKKNKKQI